MPLSLRWHYYRVVAHHFVLLLRIDRDLINVFVVSMVAPSSCRGGSCRRRRCRFWRRGLSTLFNLKAGLTLLEISYLRARLSCRLPYAMLHQEADISTLLLLALMIGKIIREDLRSAAYATTMWGKGTALWQLITGGARSSYLRCLNHCVGAHFFSSFNLI